MIGYLTLIFKHCLYFCILLCISNAGDLVLSSKVLQNELLVLCVADNITHISLGIISWLILKSYDKFSLHHILQSLVCGAIAGILDVDHFLMAKSFKLKDATNLPSRPFFHNTTLVVTLTAFIITFAYNKGYECLENTGWYILVAAVSHHLRDALRHGLWLWPWYTKPLNYLDYLFLSYLFPLAAGSLIKIIHFNAKREKTTDTLVV